VLRAFPLGLWCRGLVLNFPQDLVLFLLKGKLEKTQQINRGKNYKPWGSPSFFWGEIVRESHQKRISSSIVQYHMPFSFLYTLNNIMMRQKQSTQAGLFHYS